MAKFLECNCKGKCFAKQSGCCTILKETYSEKCPFQKRYRNVTNGKVYDFKKNY